MPTASRKGIPCTYLYVLDRRLECENLTTGVYFVELRAAGARVNRKVVVIREIY